MTIKKNYNIGDTVWIYGISTTGNPLYEGRVVKEFSIPSYENQTFYVIEVPTSIEPLLEIRTWHNISQDANGPVGGFRSIKNPPAIKKVMKRAGLTIEDTIENVVSDETGLTPVKKHKYRRRKKPQ